MMIQTFCVMALFLVGPPVVEQPLEVDRVLPSGDWSYSSHPLWVPDQSVNIVSVTTLIKEAVVAEVGLSGVAPNVSSVRLQWHLALEENGELMVLLDGYSSLIPVHTQTPAMPSRENRFLNDDVGPTLGTPRGGAIRIYEEIFRFGEVVDHFLDPSTEELTGQFRLFVQVFEIHRVDGEIEIDLDQTFQTLIESRNEISLKENFISPGEDCANQYCKLESGTGGFKYKCKDTLVPESCSLSLDEKTCTSSICTN